MAGNRIGSNEHPPGVREKRTTLHTAILQGVAVLFYSTPFVLTHYIPLKLGKYFSSYALTARWVHFLFVEKWRPLLSVRYVRSLHCRDPQMCIRDSCRGADGIPVRVRLFHRSPSASRKFVGAAVLSDSQEDPG